MNILVVICQGGWMPVHLSEGWRNLGCSVHEFFYGTHMGKDWTRTGLKNNQKINQDLLNTATTLKSQGKLDLIFAVIYDDVLTVETAKALRKLDVPMINYHVDLVGQWYRVLKTGKYFDLVACAQKDHWAGLKSLGIRPYYLPMASNPPIESKNTIQIDFDGLLYLGSPWPYRQQVLSYLAKQGINLKIYGRNWNRSKPDPANAQPLKKTIHDLGYYLLPRLKEESWQEFGETIKRRLLPKSPQQYCEPISPKCIQGSYDQKAFVPLVQGASINLGFTHFYGVIDGIQQRQVRLRDFEIPMNGGFYLTQQCEQLKEILPQEYENISWDKTSDLLEKVSYYLNYPDEREDVKQKIQAHLLKKHTWEVRFLKLLQDINMSSR